MSNIPAVVCICATRPATFDWNVGKRVRASTYA